MKTKRIVKKLNLGKSTITNLSNEVLNIVKGGAPTNATPCGGTLLSLCCTGDIGTCADCTSPGWC